MHLTRICILAQHYEAADFVQSSYKLWALSYACIILAEICLSLLAHGARLCFGSATFLIDILVLIATVRSRV
eukprot:1713760-Rhodomonas_salina.1